MAEFEVLKFPEMRWWDDLVEVATAKEAVRQRNLARRGLQIAKPIRPGQHYPITNAGAPVVRPGNVNDMNLSSTAYYV